VGLDCTFVCGVIRLQITHFLRFGREGAHGLQILRKQSNLLIYCHLK
jgi:hypothetical protein